MAKSTYFNDSVAHQVEQAPVIAEPGYDGGALPDSEGEPFVSTGDFFSTYEQWEIRMKFIAGWRKGITRRKRLPGDEP